MRPGAAPAACSRGGPSTPRRTRWRTSRPSAGSSESTGSRSSAPRTGPRSPWPTRRATPTHVERLALDSVVETGGPDPLYADTIRGRAAGHPGGVPEGVCLLHARSGGGPRRTWWAACAATAPAGGRSWTQGAGRAPRLWAETTCSRHLDRRGLRSRSASGIPGRGAGRAAGGRALRCCASAGVRSPWPAGRRRRGSSARRFTPPRPVRRPRSLGPRHAARSRRSPARRPARRDRRAPTRTSSPSTAPRCWTATCSPSAAAGRWPARRRRPPAHPLPNVPVLLLEGEDDLRTPVENARRVAARFPQAQLVVAPATGHSVLGSRHRARVPAARSTASSGAARCPPDAGRCAASSSRSHHRPPACQGAEAPAACMGCAGARWSRSGSRSATSGGCGDRARLRPAEPRHRPRRRPAAAAPTASGRTEAWCCADSGSFPACG